jgi:tetratricopeptide (TPR) repeat protein
LLPARANYKLSTRAGDWVAYDYAYNLLNNCEPNGIIFTNGDNDTFPLWALQEAYGVRNDVRVVNLSLLNTDWYIKQLQKLEPRVPISYTEDEIDNLQPRLNPAERPFQHTLAGITVTSPGIQQRRVLRVQDVMVMNIVGTTNWSKPIYFATTVSEDNLMGLAPFLQARGLAYRLMPERVTPSNAYNLDRTLELIDTVFSLRGIGKAKFNDTSRRLLTNYLQVAFELRRPMESLKRELDALRMAANEEDAAILADVETEVADTLAEKAVDVKQSRKNIAHEKFVEAEREYNRKAAIVDNYLAKCVEMMPWDWRVYAIRNEFLIDNGRFDEAIDAMESALKNDPDNIEHYRMLLEQAKMAKERH